MKSMEEIKRGMMDAAASYYGQMVVGRLVGDKSDESSNYDKYVAVAALLKDMFDVEATEVQTLAYGRYGAEMRKAEENPEKYREEANDLFRICDMFAESEG